MDCEVFRDNSFDMFVEATVDMEVPAEVVADRIPETCPEATAEERDVAAEAIPVVSSDVPRENVWEMYARVCTLYPCSSVGAGMLVGLSPS